MSTNKHEKQNSKMKELFPATTKLIAGVLSFSKKTQDNSNKATERIDNLDHRTKNILSIASILRECNKFCVNTSKPVKLYQI